jgi:hypothetical protein
MMNDKIELKATKLPDDTAIGCVACRHVSERPLVAAVGEAQGEDIVICPHCLVEGDIGTARVTCSIRSSCKRCC